MYVIKTLENYQEITCTCVVDFGVVIRSSVIRKSGAATIVSNRYIYCVDLVVFSKFGITPCMTIGPNHG